MKETTGQILLRASATAIGLAGIAILLSYVIAEINFRMTGTYVPTLQMFSFELLQVILVVFSLWPSLRKEDFKCSAGKLILSVLLGGALALWLDSDTRQFFKLAPPPPDYARLSTGDLLLGSGTFHGAFWLFFSGLLVPASENLLYRHLLFKVANGAPTWLIGSASLATYVLAYAFNGGLEGALFALQFGLVVTVLRVRTASALCPIIVHMIYGLVVEGTTLGLYLP